MNPYLVLGRGLTKRGHRFVLATTKPFQKDAERSGLEFAPLTAEEEMPDEEAFKIIMDARRGPEYVIRQLIMPRIREQYALLEKAALDADLLLSHPITYAAPVLAEKNKLRWLSTVLQPMIFFSAHDPPMLSPAPWLHGLMKRLPPAVNKPLIHAMKRVSLGWTAPVRELRRELGLPLGKDPIFDGQHSPFGVLAFFSSRLAQAKPDWPANVRVCGFLFHDEDIDARALDPRLEEFLRHGPPPVVFTFGSSAVRIAADLYRRAMRAAAGLGLRAVILAGPHADLLRAEAVQGKIFVAPSAPYHWLFPRCSAIVHQAGIGTLAQAMRSGKPMLIVPFSHDQFDNARLAQESGIAKVIRSRGVNAEAIATHLEAILDDSRMAEEARLVGESIRLEDGLKTACDQIERQLSLG